MAAMMARSNGELASAECVERLRILADPTRLQVLRELADGALHVGDLNERIPIAQNLLSHHLRVLREAGLVSATRDGKCVLYALGADARVIRRSLSIDLGCCKLDFKDR
jgi:ArsR family transcriptional regulator